MKFKIKSQEGYSAEVNIIFMKNWNVSSHIQIKVITTELQTAFCRLFNSSTVVVVPILLREESDD